MSKDINLKNLQTPMRTFFTQEERWEAFKNLSPFSFGDKVKSKSTNTLGVVIAILNPNPVQNPNQLLFQVAFIDGMIIAETLDNLDYHSAHSD